MPQKKKVRITSIPPEDAVISNYLMQKNLDKNFVQRAYDPNRQSIQVPGKRGRSTHLMGYDPGSQRVYPEVVQQNGQLKHLQGDDAWNYADSTGEYIQMPPSEKTMKMFSGYGYKHASGIPMYPNGGRVPTQWQDYPNNPSTPGYVDYGSMYSVPGAHGLFHKVPNRDTGWEGFGNPANLLQNQPASQPTYSSPRPMVQGVKKNNPDNYYDAGVGDVSEYSIDRVREQYMKNGGYMNKKRVTIVEAPKMANGGWASQRQLGLYLPMPLAYGAKPYQQVDPEYRMKNTLSAVPREESDIEAERGEHITGDFDGDGAPESMAIGGKRHSEGGTPLSVPDGAFVYSDTQKLKIKDPNILAMFDATKPATPGKLAKKYPLNDWKSQMENPDTDPMARKTAEMMYANNLKKLAQLREVQELTKAAKGIPPSPQRMAVGGDTGSKRNYDDYTDMGDSQRIINREYTRPIPGKPTGRKRTGVNPNNMYRFDQNPTPSDPAVPTIPGLSPTPANMQQGLPTTGTLGTPPTPQPGYVPQPVAVPPYTPVSSQDNATTDGRKRKVRIEGLSADAIEDMAYGMKALNTKKYTPWEPAVQVVKPSLLLESDQPIRNVLAENTNALTNALYAGDTKAGRAAVSNAQGELLRRSIQAAGEVSNRNQIAGNRYSELLANIDNQRLQAERERATRLYDKNVIADQQYRNSLNALGQELADRYRQREDKEAYRQWQNLTSLYFMTDRRGRPEFKSPEAEAIFMSKMREVEQGHPGMSDSQTIKTIKDQYIAAGGDPENASDFADDWYRKRMGLNNRTTTTTKSGNKITKETKGKYGGMLASRRC